MIHLNKKEDCCGCHACVSICPAKCIQMQSDAEGFLYPVTDESLCTDCGLCESVCPVLNPPVQEGESVAFAAWNRDEAVREDSSSGGVFNALMQRTFEKNGVVFGAAFDDSLTLRHQAAHNEAEGRALRGSKYLQSVIGVYRGQTPRLFAHVKGRPVARANAFNFCLLISETQAADCRRFLRNLSG